MRILKSTGLNRLHKINISWQIKVHLNFLLSTCEFILIMWGSCCSTFSFPCSEPLFFLFILCISSIVLYRLSYNLWPSWSWSYDRWIYNYLCNMRLSPLKLWDRTPFMARCTWDNSVWSSLSVTCDFPPTMKLTITI